PGTLPLVGSAGWSPTQIAVGLAWLVAACVVLAAYFILRATFELAQRRGAFVSAVTHELRTPLTTFRMYTDMLGEDMVESEAQRSRYVETLRREAKRLDHLVENVLAYARIEDRRAEQRKERLPVSELLAGFEA